jgi:alkanesulfonate monooxygenase SsuD/methylene tetrahydromethanopterin reductase-like flavin-dependent oxidoreductase (luciferase family)
MSAALAVGLVLPTRFGPSGVPHDRLLELAEFADTHAGPEGWSHVWVPDSLLSLPYLDSGVLLAALAARTRRVRLGVACLASLGFRHPVTVARQWADLDALSRGRMQLVACPGNASGAAVERELAVYGIDYTEKIQRFEEAVRFLRLAGRDPAVSFHGRRLHVDDLQLVPGFVQQPFPIWIAGNPSPSAGARTVDRVLGRVAALADGWMTFNVTPQLLRERLDRLRDLRVAALGDASADPSADGDFPVCVWLNANVAPDAEAARRDAVARWGETSTRNVGIDDLARISAIGSVSQAVDFVGRLREAGATHLAIDCLSLDPVRQAETLTRLLVPALADAFGPVGRRG